MSTLYLQIHRSTSGGASASYIYNGIADAGYGTTSNFIAPFTRRSEQFQPDVRPGARASGGAGNVKASVPSWTSIKPSVGSVISAIAVQQGNADVIRVGHNNGNVYKTVNGTSASPIWTRIDLDAPPLPNRYLTRIAIDPHDASTVYATFGGFSADNLWKTTNGGTNWSDVTGSGATGLPDVPVRDVEVHPSHANWLYAATEVGNLCQRRRRVVVDGTAGRPRERLSRTSFSG